MFVSPGSRPGFPRASSRLGSSLVLIDRKVAVASASLDFVQNIGSLYDIYQFELNGLWPATNAVELWIQISQDHGATWKAGAGTYRWTSFVSTDAATSAPTGSTSDTQIKMTNNGVSNVGGRGISGFAKMYQESTTFRQFVWELAHVSSAPNQLLWVGSGIYVNDTAPVTGVRFKFSSGNIATGSIALYGMRKP